MNYHMNTQPLTCGNRVSADPTRQRDENRGGARDCAAAVELADGEDSDDTKATYMIPVTRGTDWCKWRDLRPSGGGSSPVMAARQSFGAVY